MFISEYKFLDEDFRTESQKLGNNHKKLLNPFMIIPSVDITKLNTFTYKLIKWNEHMLPQVQNL